MTKRSTKQLIIAFIFIFILAGFGFLIYYLVRPAPSCFDGIQNQAEEGIDCGGPCPSCQIANLERIKVDWVKAIPAQKGFYDLAALITNPNQNYGSGRAPYQFKLYDAQNNFIDQVAGLTYILPNQTKYLVKARVASASPVSRAELAFGEVEWQKIEEYQLPQLVISEKKYRLLPPQEPGFSQASGLLINRSNFDFDKIEIDILLFDSSGLLLAVGTTQIRTLLAGQERDFVATWFREITGQVALVEMEVETNIFDPDNFLSSKDIKD